MIWPFTSARDAAAYRRGIEDAANFAAVRGAELFAQSRSTPQTDVALWRAALHVESLSQDIRRLDP